MVIETWVAASIIVAVFGMGLISIFGWIIEGERLERAEREIRKLIKENERLHKIINQMNGLQTIKAADDFNKKEK